MVPVTRAAVEDTVIPVWSADRNGISVAAMSAPHMPERSNLVAECRRVMLLRIRAGEWGDTLPGERRLAEILQVGRDTVRLALGQLEQEAIVDPADGRKRRRIRHRTGNGAPRTASSSLRVGMLSPCRLESLPHSMLIEVDHVRKALAAKNGTLELYSPAWYEDANPSRPLGKFLKEETPDVWLLYRASRAVQHGFETAAVPCLVRGYPLAGSRLPHLDVDWRATARHASARLWRAGHRRVGIIAASDSLAGVAAAVDGAMSFDGGGFSPVEIMEDGTVEGLVRPLARALAGGQPPTALIATRPHQAATALTWLVGRGFNVPEHLSIVTLSREPYLEYLVPCISGYRIAPAAVARLVIRRLERLHGGGQALGGSPWLVPTEEEGDSIGPPPAGC